MEITTAATAQKRNFTNRILHGDCIEVMRKMPANSVDFILTDLPYLVNYRDRSGGRSRMTSMRAGSNQRWPRRTAYSSRIVSPSCSMDGPRSMRSSKRGATPVFSLPGTSCFAKSYSSKSRFLRYQHEQAFLLAKGRPPLPKHPLGDVMDMPYSGNKLHPTQKPVPALAQLIRSFSLPGESVLDSFAGSGSTCAAALLTGRNYIGVEMDDTYFLHASERLQRVHQRVVEKLFSNVSIPTRV